MSVRVKPSRPSHSHKTRTEVSSSVPHFLQMGLSLSPTSYKCRLRLLCPVRRSLVALDGAGGLVQLRDSPGSIPNRKLALPSVD